MDNTLIIDCSSGMNIIVLKENEVFKFLDSNQKRHTDELLLSVDRLLKEANLNIGDIKNLCVTVGPGSFTGIRVAISICKGLAIGNNAKIFTLSNFDAYSFGSEQSKTICVLDGFSDFVYARINFGEKFEDSCEHTLDLIEKIKTNFDDYKVFVQSEKLKRIFDENGLQSTIAKLDLIDGFAPKIKNNETTNINQIVPIYLRASQAEIERNKKLSGE